MIRQAIDRPSSNPPPDPSEEGIRQNANRLPDACPPIPLLGGVRGGFFRTSAFSVECSTVDVSPPFPSAACSPNVVAYPPRMAKPAKKKAVMIGVGLDSDGHKRVTQGPNFVLSGGSKETHEEMTEKAIKINEKLKAKGKELHEVSREEFDDIAHAVGLKRNKPESN